MFLTELKLQFMTLLLMNCEHLIQNMTIIFYYGKLMYT